MPPNYVAVIRTFSINGKDYDRVAIIATSDQSLCSEGDILVYVKPRSRYEGINNVLSRGHRIASLLNKGETCASQS